MGERLFQKLKPVCVDLVRAPSSAVLSSLLAIVQEADDESLQPLQQYVLLPLRIILKGDVQRSSDIIEGAVDAIGAVFTHTEVTSFEVFSDFFVVLSLLISSGPEEIRAGRNSEELKHSATKCLTSLVAASNEEVLSSLFSLKFLPPLGHAVSILLSLVEEEHLRQLRLDAMQCLCQLMPESGSAKIINMARSNFCSFLPGISMSLCRVIQGDPKQGQNVTKTAIATWVKAVTWVMSDAVPPEENDGSGPDVKTPPTVKDPSSLVVKRTSEWLENTSKKLSILIGQICKQKTNSSWQVRLGLVHFATKLLIHCKRNLSDSNGPLLSLLVGFLADDWPDVAKASLEGLKEFKKKHMDSDDRKLVEVLEENLYVTMTALPRQMRSSDDDQKLATLNLVQGYLTLLGPKINQMLKSSGHLHRFSMGLLQVLEFDVKDTVLLEDASVTHQDLATSSTPSRNLFNNFKAFSDEKILSAILRICNLLGYYGDLMLLADHFLDAFRQSELHSKQACLVLNHILRGTLIVPPSDYLEKQEPANRDTLETVIEMIIDEYLSETNWSLPTSVSHPETMTTSGGLLLPQKDVAMVMTLQQIQNNTLLTCLLLEGISACAMVIGPAFDQFLIRCLYPLLEKLAADKSVIRQIAFQTLHTTAASCGYSSIADLLSSNADYLVDAISSKLRHLSWNHHAPHVLRVTIEQCDANMLPLLEDTIEEILWSLDNHYAEEILSFVALLQTIANAILKWFPPAECENLDSDQESLAHSQQPTPDPENDHKAERSKVTSIDEIREFFLDHLRNKRMADGDVRDEDLMEEEESGVVEEEDEEFNPEMKKDLPLHVKILIKILDRCKHHLATTNPRIRLKLLSTIQICVQALTNEKDQLLPAVHKLWPSLIPRFQDEEPLVVCMASDTLTTLSYSCGDFLRQRVAKDVLPKLICILDSSAATSRKAGPAYAHTAAHKLQLAILSLVGPLCQQLDVGESELNNLISACLEYLSAKQPLALQEACRKTFSCFIELEPDSVWLLLNDVNQSEQLIPTSPDLSVVKFANHMRAKEFEQNCRILLCELNGITPTSNMAKSGEG